MVMRDFKNKKRRRRKTKKRKLKRRWKWMKTGEEMPCRGGVEAWTSCKDCK